MEALRSRLLYQLPEEPSVDNVAAIAEARDKLVATMQAEWNETITKGRFEGLAKSRPTPRSSKPSGTLAMIDKPLRERREATAEVTDRCRG